MPVADRVQLIRAGSDYTVPRKPGGVSMGIHTLAVLEPGDPRLVGTPLPGDGA